MFTPEFLNHIFDLDCETGELYNKTGSSPIISYTDGRYGRVKIRGKRYYAHKVIWCMVHGYWPEHDIDHADGDGYNNRPYNLRKTTASQNIANADFGKFRGVERHGAQWRARIQVDGVRVELGSYATFDEAKAAYQAGADRYFGEHAFHNRSEA